MAQTQTQLNRKSMEKRGIKQKKFDLDVETITLFTRVAQATEQTQIQLFKAMLAEYAQKRGIS